MHKDVEPISKDNLVEMYLNRNWRANLTVIGIDGIPSTSTAGNVLRKGTKVCISIRLPPSFDSKKVQSIVESKLLVDVPYNAKVKVYDFHSANGFCAKPREDWL